MGVNWRIRLGALFLAVGLLGSSALAARLERATDNVDASGACAMTCERNVTDMHLDPYPAYQPLEVCDDVCIFYQTAATIALTSGRDLDSDADEAGLGQYQ